MVVRLAILTMHTITQMISPSESADYLGSGCRMERTWIWADLKISSRRNCARNSTFQFFFNRFM